MTFTARWGILFVMVLLANRASPGIVVENLWYSFVWASMVSILNAWIRTVILFFKIEPTWFVIALFAAFLNLFLYVLLSLGFGKGLEMTATLSSALWAAFIVGVSSTLCNHFIGFRGPNK